MFDALILEACFFLALFQSAGQSEIVADLANRKINEYILWNKHCNYFGSKRRLCFVAKFPF